MKIRSLIAALGAAFAIGSVGIADAGYSVVPAAARDFAQPPGRPGSDAWITNQVKANLAATDGLPAAYVGVRTVDGVVILSGILDSRTQVRTSIGVATAVHGVMRVDASALTSTK